MLHKSRPLRALTAVYFPAPGDVEQQEAAILPTRLYPVRAVAGVVAAFDAYEPSQRAVEQLGGGTTERWDSRVNDISAPAPVTRRCLRLPFRAIRSELKDER